MLEPTLKQYLPEAIGKLGGYYSATFELICAARDRTCRVFQNVQVEPSRSRCPPPSRNHPGRFTLRYSSSSFMSFIHTISDRDSFALAAFRTNYLRACLPIRGKGGETRDCHLTLSLSPSLHSHPMATQAQNHPTKDSAQRN
jgi:hypothetical protein